MNRYLAALAVVFLASAGWFAWSTTSDGLVDDHPAGVEDAVPPAGETASAPAGADAAADAALFDARCGMCHTREDMVAYLRGGSGIDARARELAELLASHGPGTSDENARIVAFLEAAAR